MSCWRTVSYTHLDVYKRQEYQLVNSLEKQVAALSRQQQAEQEAIVRDEAGLA